MLDAEQFGVRADSPDNAAAFEALRQAMVEQGRSASIGPGTFFTSAAHGFSFTRNGMRLDGDSQGNTTIFTTHPAAHGLSIASDLEWLSVSNIRFEGIGRNLSEGHGLHIDGTGDNVDQLFAEKIVVKGYDIGISAHAVACSRFSGEAWKCNIGVKITGNSNSLVFDSMPVTDNLIGVHAIGGNGITFCGGDIAGNERSVILDGIGPVKFDTLGFEQSGGDAFITQNYGVLKIDACRFQEMSNLGQTYTLRQTAHGCHASIMATASGAQCDGAHIRQDHDINMSVFSDTPFKVAVFKDNALRNRFYSGPFRVVSANDGATPGEHNHGMIYGMLAEGYDGGFRASVRNGDGTYVFRNL